MDIYASLLHAHDRLDDLARRRVGEGAVDVRQVVEAYELVEWEAPLPVEADERRDRLARHGVALVDADDPNAFDDEVENVERDFGVRARRADDAAGAAWPDAVDSLAQDRHDAGGLECVVGTAAAGQSAHRLDGVALGGVDGVRGTETVGELQACGVDVDGDYRRAREIRTGHHGAKPTAPAPNTTRVSPGAGRR